LDWTKGYVDVRYHKHAQIDVERFDFERQGVFRGTRYVSETVTEAAPEEASAWASEAEARAAAEHTVSKVVNKDIADGMEVTMGTAAEVAAFALAQTGDLAGLSSRSVTHQVITEVRLGPSDNVVEWDVQQPLRLKGGLVGVKEALAEPLSGGGETDVRTKLLAKLQRFNLEKAYKLEKSKADYDAMYTEYEEMKMALMSRQDVDQQFASDMAELREKLVCEEKITALAQSHLAAEKRNCEVKIQRAQVDKQELVTLRQVITASSNLNAGAETTTFGNLSLPTNRWRSS
jgi:hypothetical protein